jgi:hypothetical protein
MDSGAARGWLGGQRPEERGGRKGAAAAGGVREGREQWRLAGGGRKRRWPGAGWRPAGGGRVSRV